MRSETFSARLGEAFTLAFDVGGAYNAIRVPRCVFPVHSTKSLLRVIPFAG